MSAETSRRSRSICALMISALIIAACGSSGGKQQAAPTTTEAPLPKGTTLTTAQAVRLSRVFFANYDKGGADVVVDVPFGVQSSVRITAKVDWKGHRGSGTILTTFTDGRAPVEQPLWWYSPDDLTNGAIVTTVAGLPEAMAEQGRPGIKYVARPISERSALDITLRFLDRLSADRAENPILLRQGDVGYLGGVILAGVPCDHIRFGAKGTQYWIGTTDGHLRQVSARLSGLARPTVYRFGALGTQQIADPGSTEVVDARDIPDLYQRLTSKGSKG